MGQGEPRGLPEPPFFVVASVRSGTTLLRLMLGHHPSICRCEEMEYVATPIARGQPFPSRSRYAHFLRTHRGFRASGHEIDERLEFLEQAHDFLVQQQAEDGRPHVGKVVHGHFAELPRVWPDARYIHLVRDPRDVARSCVKMGFSGSPYNGAKFWVAAFESWSRLKEIVPAERRLELRFEDLVSEPQLTLERVCAFLGVPYDEAMQDIERDTTYRRPDPRAARSWRDTASDDEVAQVEARVGRERLEAAGYPPSDVPPLSQDRLNLLRIRAADVYTRVRFRHRRYGVGLWAAGVLSRRLPWQGLRDAVQRRIDAVDEQHLK